MTQNVDGYHRQAGSRRLLEIHGSLQRSRCLECGTRKPTPLQPGIPYCSCGGMLRPDVVWFGETLPVAALQQSLELAQNCDLFITAGTSGLVEPAASFMSIAAANGALTVEINPIPTAVSNQATVLLRGEADQVFPAIWSILEDKI